MSRDFDGVNDGIEIDPFIDNTGSITMMAWVRPDTVTPADRMTIGGFHEIGDFATHDKNLGIDINGKANFYIFDGSLRTAIGATTLSVSVWQHIAGVHEVGAGTPLRVYLDGVQDGSNATAGTSYNYTTPVMTLGNANGAGRYPIDFDGRIADYRIWSVALSVNEINMAMRGKIVRPDSLLLWWLVGHGSPEADLSGNGRNGTVTGTTIADGPPVARPFARNRGYQGNFTATAAGGDTILQPLYLNTGFQSILAQ